MILCYSVPIATDSLQVDDTVALLSDDFLQVASVEITKCRRYICKYCVCVCVFASHVKWCVYHVTEMKQFPYSLLEEQVSSAAPSGSTVSTSTS